MIIHSLLHTVALILSSTAIIIFMQASRKLEGNLKTSYIYISIGILIAVTIHSFLEHLESLGVISTENLLVAMPILVSFGAISFIIGGWIVLKKVE